MKCNSHQVTGSIEHPTHPTTVKLSCARANYRAAGWEDADFKKPVVTIGVPYSNIMPCNNKMHEL